MASRSKGKRGVVVEHDRRLGAPRTDERFDAESEKEINALERTNVEAS